MPFYCGKRSAGVCLFLGPKTSSTYSSEYASGFFRPAASHLPAPPSPRNEGLLGQAPSRLPFSRSFGAVVFLLTSLVLCVFSPDVSLSDPTREDPSVAPSSLPFPVGERLSYDLTWLAMRAGIATMAVHEHEAHEGRPQIQLNLVARSSPVVTKFYPVDNRVASTVDVEPFLPRHMTFARREGKRSNDFDYTFRHSEGLVTAVKDGKREELPIPADAQDAISCLYYVRKVLPMVPGASLVMNVHHDNKNYKLEVRVEALETLKGSWGKQQTARVLVVMPFQGIFLNEGNIRVWFTTDGRRIPVRMKAKVIIGSIVAELMDGYRSGRSS